MDIKTTKKIIKGFPKRSIMLHAKHGVGKSSTVKQCAIELGINYEDVRLSQCEVGDIKGLPFKSEDLNGNVISAFAKPKWFPKDQDSKGILFFDELNRASKEVLQAVFELCLDRRLDGDNLPDGWIIVSAVNSDDDYDVVELDPALQDRFFHIDFEPSPDEWLSWARESGIEKFITQFVSQNKELLDPPVGNLESGKVYPSRRSWEAFNEFVELYKLMDDTTMFMQCAKGWLGQEIAIMLQKFVKNEFKIFSANDVLEDWDKNKDDIEQASEDIEIISTLANNVVKEINERRANKLSDKNKENFYDFFMSLPSDVASGAWVSILEGKKSVKIAMEWQAKDEFADRLSEIFIAD
jgi:hypothetical protein